MPALPDTIENQLLDALFGVASYTVTTPIKVALVTANGTDSAAGTEVTGGSYARQSVTFASASAGATSNTNTLTWSGMPAATVVGIEIYDSAGTPKRLAYGSLSVTKTVGAGDTFQIAIGDLDVTLD